MIYGNPLLLGGSGLDLTVVGSTTQPASPKENTVWINTDTPVGDVYIQASAPASPALGDVWINNASAGTDLNVCESPYLEITVGTTKQYDGLGWSDCDVQIYKGGEWLSSVLYIFFGGNWNDGMQPNLFKYWDRASDLLTSSTDKLTSIDTEKDCLKLYLKYASSSARGAYTVCPAVDVTKYNSLVIEYAIPKSKSSSYQGKYQAMISPDTTVTGGTTNDISITNGIGAETSRSAGTSVPVKEKTTQTTDITLLSGNYYPIFAGFSSLTDFRMDIYSMYLTS